MQTSGSRATLKRLSLGDAEIACGPFNVSRGPLAAQSLGIWVLTPSVRSPFLHSLAPSPGLLINSQSPREVRDSALHFMIGRNRTSSSLTAPLPPSNCSRGSCLHFSPPGFVCVPQTEPRFFYPPLFTPL